METANVKNKFHENWEVVNKKIEFDSSYRFKPGWWIMFWVFCILCIIYLVFGIFVFTIYFIEPWDITTLRGIGLGCGFSLILIFALFWITNNFINSPIAVKADYPEEVKKMIKKQSVWMNTFRICAAFLTLACGLMYVTSAFMWDSLNTIVNETTIRVVAGVSILLFIALGGVCIAAYYQVIIRKQQILNILVPKHTKIEEAKK